MKKQYLIHPIFFAISPVLFIYSHNIDQMMPYSIMVYPLILMLLGVICLIRLSLFITKDVIKASVLSSIFLALFFSFGHVFKMIKYLLPFTASEHILIIWGFLYGLSSYCVVKSRGDFINLTKVLNGTAVALVLMSLVNIGIFEGKNRFGMGSGEKQKDDQEVYLFETQADNLQDLQFVYKITKSIKRVYNDFEEKFLGKSDGTIESDKVNKGTSEKSNSYRDIYYIVPDRYTNNKILDEVYNFDNSYFTDYLTEKGFYVASESRSNYSSTVYSLLSSFNMDYILPTGPRYSQENNEVVLFLKSKGYKFVNIGAWVNRHADINFSIKSISNFSMILYKTTILYPIAQKLGFFDPRMEHRDIQLYRLEKLAATPDIRGPKFVFTHIMVPHPPFVFDRNGNYVTEEDIKGKDWNESYIEQVMFLNKKLQEIIDSIISRSETPPIIILQGDEGPYPAKVWRDHEDEDNAVVHRFDLDLANSVDIRQKMSIINAYYLPDFDTSVLYPSITPVNSFRLIFNSYFNTDYKLVPDTSYFSSRTRGKVFDVTDYFNND